jgi:hypothetical protein
MIKYVVFKAKYRKFWQKRYLWIVYSYELGGINSGWAWTHNGASNEAEY